MPADTAFMEKLVALCKRRGFIFQSSEIYGGIGGFWDYGPLGVELKRNIKDAWWRDMVTNPPEGPDGRQVQMVGVDCSIIMNPKVWEASGHATGFADPMVDCKACKRRFRADQVWAYQVLGETTIDAPSFKLATMVGSPLTFTKINLNDSGYGWIASAQMDSSDDAMANIEGILADAAKKLNIQALKSATIVNRNFTGHEVVATLTARDGQKLQVLAKPLNTSGVWVINQSTPRPCPECRGELTDMRQFNLMFKTYVGALEDDSARAWLRPETAQGIFCNYKNVLDTARVKLPFGIAQVGKAFRNEINPRNFTFRSREFEQMEIEFFCRDEDSMKWYEFWRNVRYNWYTGLGLRSDKLRLRDQGQDELAHYSRACADIEYLFPFSDEFQELEGVAHRGCFDLTQHETHSGQDLHYFDEEAWARFLAGRKERGEPELTREQKAELGGKTPYRFLPTVIEPSAGADRATLAFLCEAYTEDSKPDAKGVMQTRVYLRFHPRLAPIKAAFLPLVNKEGMPQIAEKLHREARRHFNVFYDDGGSIGRRYARMDEAGTPYCVTVDGQTLADGTVTVRDRDTLEQPRVSQDKLIDWLRERVGG